MAAKTKLIEVHDAANLAVLIQVCPDAQVQRLIAEPGQDAWLVHIDLAEGQCVDCGNYVANGTITQRDQHWQMLQQVRVLCPACRADRWQHIHLPGGKDGAE